MLRALVEKQQKEIEQKDETIRRQNIQIESMLQALLHARKQRFGRSSEATEFPGQLSLSQYKKPLTSICGGASYIEINAPRGLQGWADVNVS